MSQDDSLILGRLNARESSTLTIATVAASASLILLSLVIDRKLGTEYAWLYLVGIGFAILGIFYREVTFLSIDQAEYGLLTLHTQIMIRASSNWQRRKTSSAYHGAILPLCASRGLVDLHWKV